MQCHCKELPRPVELIIKLEIIVAHACYGDF